MLFCVAAVAVWVQGRSKEKQGGRHVQSPHLFPYLDRMPIIDTQSWNHVHCIWPNAQVGYPGQQPQLAGVHTLP